MEILRIKPIQRQSGAALVEFIIVAAVLIPIMFGVPMIGKIIDLKQTTVQASRYSAWETTVSDQPAQNLDQRFFSDASAPIGSSEVGPNTLWGPVDETVANAQASAEITPAEPEPLSGYQADTAVVVLSGAAVSTPSAYEPGVNSMQYAPAANEGAARKVGEAVKSLGVLSEETEGTMHEGSMKFDGLIRGEASVQVQSNGWLGQQTIKQGTVIMNDNWSVGDAVAARNRVRSLVPANALDKVGKLIGTVGNVPGIRELKPFADDGGRRIFGHIDMEPLPPSESTGLRPLKEYVE